MEGKCLVCGGTDDTSRHHILPECIEKHIKEHKKLVANVPLCRKCHDKYEEWAYSFKQYLCQKHNIFFDAAAVVIDPHKKILRDTAKVLLKSSKYRHTTLYKMHKETLEELTGNKIDQKELVQLAAIGVTVPIVGYIDAGSQLLEAYSLKQLQTMWAKHFMIWFNDEIRIKNPAIPARRGRDLRIQYSFEI